MAEKMYCDPWERVPAMLPRFETECRSGEGLVRRKLVVEERHDGWWYRGQLQVMGTKFSSSFRGRRPFRSRVEAQRAAKAAAKRSG